MVSECLRAVLVTHPSAQNEGDSHPSFCHLLAIVAVHLHNASSSRVFWGRYLNRRFKMVRGEGFEPFRPESTAVMFRISNPYGTGAFGRSL